LTKTARYQVVRDLDPDLDLDQVACYDDDASDVVADDDDDDDDDVRYWSR